MMSGRQSYPCTINNVLESIPLPDDEQTKESAERMLNGAGNILYLLQANVPKDADFSNVLGAVLACLQSAGGRFDMGRDMDLLNRLAKDYMLFSSWIRSDNSGPKEPTAKEFSHFVYFISDLIHFFARKGRPIKRLVLPLHNMYQDPSDEDEPEESDLALELIDPTSDWRDQSVIGTDNQAQSWTTDTYRNVLGSVLFDDKPMDMAIHAFHALKKHFMRLSDVCDKQCDRRFTWGIDVTRTLVRIHLAGPQFSVLTEPLDVTTHDGRRAFIRHLVHWVYCDESNLGYDPNMSYLRELDCWEINIQERVFYGYGDPYYVNDTTGYNRATYMLAKTTKPTLPEDGSKPQHKVEEGDVMIKDIWEIMGKDCPEVEALTMVDAALKDKDRLKGLYSKIIVGGAVQIDGTDDSERLFLGETNWNLLEGKKPYIHMRIVTEGVAMPLSSVPSVDHLVTVIADAMEALSEIAKSCRLLHNNITPDSILLRTMEDEQGIPIQRGVLTNFDKVLFLKK